MDKWIVVGSNSDGKVQVFGTKSARLYLSEQAAEKAARRLEKRYPHVSAFAAPLSEFPEDSMI